MIVKDHKMNLLSCSWMPTKCPAQTTIREALTYQVAIAQILGQPLRCQAVAFSLVMWSVWDMIISILRFDEEFGLVQQSRPKKWRHLSFPFSGSPYRGFTGSLGRKEQRLECLFDKVRKKWTILWIVLRLHIYPMTNGCETMISVMDIQQAFDLLWTKVYVDSVDIHCPTKPELLWLICWRGLLTPASRNWHTLVDSW